MNSISATISRNGLPQHNVRLEGWVVQEGALRGGDAPALVETRLHRVQIHHRDVPEGGLGAGVDGVGGDEEGDWGSVVGLEGCFTL